jgi:hypothetical protein
MNERLMRSFPEIEHKPIIEAAEDAHSFLRAIYQNPNVPLPVRMKAATIAIEYERPSLKATAIIHPNGSFAERLEKAISRSQAPPKLIEHQPPVPPLQHSARELGPTPKPKPNNFIRRS